MADNRHSFGSSDSMRKVLVVEDEMINKEILGAMLQDEFDLIFAETGAEAVKAIDENCSDLGIVLLDLNLPDMNGMDILKKIKGDTRTMMLPVIVMTADADAEVESLELGAVDFIPKPYPRKEVIIARIRKTIELFEKSDIINATEKDQLTGAYNREFFYRYCSQFDLRHPDEMTDALVIDINHFHILNERYGRTYADDLLKSVAERLLELFPESDGIVCRKEADTFLVYCLHRDSYDGILDSVSSVLGDGSRVRFRIGVYAETDRSIEIERVFDRAKLAADKSKSGFAGSVAFYDSAIHEKEVLADQLIDNFSTAIKEKQFAVYFQPKFDIRPVKPVLSSAEALVRWIHPELGMVSPDSFIPVFEENGLIQQLDIYVWRETAAKIKEWKTTLGRSIPVSVNVSRIDLYNPDLLNILTGIKEEFGLTAEEFLLEITESAYTEDSEQIIKVVNALRDSGFRIEMDDFGSGYSSLNMITALPIDVLKLDMQFIRTAFKKRKDTRLLEAIVGLAKSMDFSTIAEGVETAEQMFTMKAMGCDVIQGYYFSRPLPAADFEKFVRDLDSEDEKADDMADSSKKESSAGKYTYEALHDPLTGLYNHSAFDILFRDSDKDHIAVMISKINEYQDIKDEKGPEFARKVILHVAEVLHRSFRSADDICRLQENEFAIIMSRMNSEMEWLVADKMQQIDTLLSEQTGELPPLSLSTGIAFSDRKDPHGDVFADADAALARMLEKGETGCVVY